MRIKAGLIISTLMACSPQFPEPPDVSGWIYFDSNRTGDFEIYRMSADGTDIVNISKSPDTDDWLSAVSPDGGRIAFMRGHFSDFHSFEIWVMDADGSNQTQLTHNDKADGHPDWSPDGRQIVFVSWRDNDDQEIYIMDADGSNQRRLTHIPGIDNDPDWSPCGRYIAFKSVCAYPDSVWEGDENFNPYLEIFIMDTTGTIIRQLTHDLDADHDPDWSPDGGEIAYLHTNLRRMTESGTIGVYIMDTTGNNQRILTDPKSYCWYTSFSPDGQFIAFCSSENGNTDIYLMRRDGSDPVRITDHFATDEFPAWTP